MIAILGGLLAASSFTVSILASARTSRLIGSPSTLTGAMGIGLLLALPAALLIAPAPRIDAETIGWTMIAGGGNVVGLLLTYLAYRIGSVGIVATINSTEGAIAALLAVLGGEALAPGAGPVLGLIAVGVVLAATGGGHEEEEGVPIPRDRSLRAAGLALVAAFAFGLGIYGAARLAESVPVAWAILPPRIVGVLFVALPLGLLRRVRITRAALPLVTTVALAEIVGYVAFVSASHDGIAVAAVLTSMFAPFSTIAAYVLFRERLGRRQVLGIVAVVAGAAALGFLRS